MSEARQFGTVIRKHRLRRASNDGAFSLRQVARRVGIEPSYLSKIERGQQQPPGEDTIRRLAADLGEDADSLLALAGKVSTDLIDIIRARPAAVAEPLRSVRHTPTKRVAEIARQVRDGNW